MTMPPKEFYRVQRFNFSMAASRRFLTLIFFLILAATNIFGQENNIQSKVLIESPDKATDEKIGAILHNCTFQRLPMAGGSHYSAIVNQDQLKELNAKGIRHTILTKDISTQEPTELSESQKNAILENARKKYGFQNFHFGSFKGFLNYEEVVAELASMKKKYPELISEKKSIGKTAEGKDIWMVKIGHDNHEILKSYKKPNVLYTSLIHANEPQSMATLIYFMYYLLENHYMGNKPTRLGEGLPSNFDNVYKDIFAKMFVDVVNSYFIPVLNPDGYKYNYNQYLNHNIDKPGQRKNRSGRQKNGVDLNRNFSTDWVANADSSSPVYPGPYAFSEHETQAIKALCDTVEFTTSMDWHAYGNSILYPWGTPNYRYLNNPDNITFANIARSMAYTNKYEWGGIWQILYTANGDINAWLYKKHQNFSLGGEVGNNCYQIPSKNNNTHWMAKSSDRLKNWIKKLDSASMGSYKTCSKNTLESWIENTLQLQLTYDELDSLNSYYYLHTDGFYPSLDRIIPLARENVDANMNIGWAAVNIKTMRGVLKKKKNGQSLSTQEQKDFELNFPFNFYLAKDAVKNILAMYKNDFYCVSTVLTKEWANPGGIGIPNSFGVMENSTVIDNTTKLVWNLQELNQESQWNNQSRSDGWRLPTLEEAMTLLSPKGHPNHLAAENLFRNKLQVFWTSDENDANNTWAVDFENKTCLPLPKINKYQVILVKRN